jgi:heptaprenylglyceryl phosphate synthase
MAAEYLGMKLVYLEAGSGALRTVPEGLITETRKNISLPIICGGGIRSPHEAAKKVTAGASFIVVGNRFEEDNDLSLYREFAEAIHQRQPFTVGTTKD